MLSYSSINWNILFRHHLIDKTLIWKNSSKITDRIRAKTIFNRKISNKSRIEEYTLPSFIHLLGILLQDLKIKQNTDSIKKIEDLSNSLIEFATENNSLFLQIKSNFLKSRIYLLNSNYVQSNLSLKMAENLAMKYQNGELITKIREEKTTITNKIELLKKNAIDKDNSINEIIQITEIEDAIKNLVK